MTLWTRPFQVLFLFSIHLQEGKLPTPSKKKQENSDFFHKNNAFAMYLVVLLNTD